MFPEWSPACPSIVHPSHFHQVINAGRRRVHVNKLVIFLVFDVLVTGEQNVYHSCVKNLLINSFGCQFYEIKLEILFDSNS